MVTSKFIAFFAFLFVLNNNGSEGSHQIYTEYQNLRAAKVNQTHRTGYHFQPPSNWINDYFEKGQYEE
ncbi:hypothetical protein JCGZ_06782 [Jatropha curcas]|uniref:Uncharacterized protein n=1 Tax=Jatropha curcas TaxID=180498 RepID=A0A067KQS0_JATCU|nr:hypothetical protein JCGZ_06782 [Jatropha curcas]